MLHAEKMLPSDKPMPEADLEAFAALIDQADLSSLRTWACNASFERLRPSAMPGRLASCKT